MDRLSRNRLCAVLTGTAHVHSQTESSRTERADFQVQSRFFVLSWVVPLWLLVILAGSAEAQLYGPELPDHPPQVSSFFDTRMRWRTHLPPGPMLDGRAYDTLSLSRLWSDQPEEVETIERVSGEARGPRIPEPMVFDLVRPLGAKRGETEVNTLGLVSLTRTSGRVNGSPDPLGLVRRSPDRQGIEWAPEIE